jgi:hypothetical protein
MRTIPEAKTVNMVENVASKDDGRADAPAAFRCYLEVLASQYEARP